MTTRRTLLIDLKKIFQKRPLLKFISPFKRFIEEGLKIRHLNEAYQGIGPFSGGDAFFKKSLEALGTTYSIPEEERLNIPQEGPLVIVANHPFGGIEGIILSEILLKTRKDLKIVGNFFLSSIPEINHRIISVDNIQQGKTRSNSRAIKESIRHVKNGGALLVFPAGEVSHFSLKNMTIQESNWNPHIGAIIRIAQAKVLSVYIHGTNSLAFHLAGLVHPILRTMMLVRELINQKGKKVLISVGPLISWAKLSTFKKDDDRIKYLQRKNSLLRYRVSSKFRKTKTFDFKKESPQEEIIAPLPKSKIVEEISSLLSKHILIDCPHYTVYAAFAGRIPHTLVEIGRLRELTFREVGEGTGGACDLDLFDKEYLHVFLWDKVRENIVGAYRLGLCDKIFSPFGSGVLYTHTLFKFRKNFEEDINQAIELGRSFIRKEYQKDSNSLFLLWRGIGEFIARNPQYNLLFGPVSISNEYHAISKDLMVYYFKRTILEPSYSKQVKPRNPYRSKRFGLSHKNLNPFLDSRESVSLLISAIEKDGKGLPVLLKHYLKLNAKLACFNLDSNFSNVLDSLLFVDLRETPTPFLRKVMGKEGVERFFSYHDMKNKPIEREVKKEKAVV